MGFRFERLLVWPKALEFANQSISVSLRWPGGVQSSLGDQTRRAAVSVIANIAEGSGKRTGKSARAFYDVAKGSVYEIIGIMALARKRGLVDEATFAALYRDGDEISAMLWGLMQAATKERRK
jgi:four helix bundle protein